ncbi:hypothetical protein WG922_07385 [Ramlibacter sp. AN1015]|uniref:hypothetical protein n=1 Tax=Ramlibacter sp. AN1015 TaxID=3133428 RepID=UPI0030C02BB9
MTTSWKRRVLNRTNEALRPVGLELVRKGREFQSYISVRQTLKDAERSGQSLGDFIDKTFNVPGTTQLTINKMSELGAFNQPIHRVCELGPGSGRYLDKVKKLCSPEYYEIYETAEPWRDWLVQTYQVTAQPADGVSFSSTPSGSIDLVHSHKVLYGNSILTIFRYLIEMARVAGERSVVVFDLLTAECVTNEIMMKWVESGADHAHSMTPREVPLGFFSSQGFRCAGTFIVPMSPGVTEYFVFKR